jgi:hypothetical protein
MSTDLEDTLRAALAESTADIVARPGLLDDVRRGGRRRQWGTRGVAVVAGAVAVAAVSTGGTVVVRELSGPATPTQAASLSAVDRTLLARPTGGDLADDRAYLSAVVQAWQRSHAGSPNADRGIFDHLLGQPQVVWAGHTPAGPAAIVVQAADLRRHENIQLDREGPALLTGFVGASDGEPQVVADTYPAPGAPQLEAAFIGADRNVLLVLDRDRPVELSFGRIYRDDGYVTRQWREVRFDDGAAVVPVPARTDPRAVALRPHGSGFIDIGNRLSPEPAAAAATNQEDPRLQWRAEWESGEGARVGLWLPGVGPAEDRSKWGEPLDAGSIQERFEHGLASRVPQLFPETDGVLNSLWYVWGSTLDGSYVVVGEKCLDPDPCRVYGVLRSPSGEFDVAARWTDVDGPLPVAVPLPRGQGWVVARKDARLRWASADGAWHEVGMGTALIPDAATRVEVTPLAGGDPVVVPLRR